MEKVEKYFDILLKNILTFVSHDNIILMGLKVFNVMGYGSPVALDNISAFILILISFFIIPLELICIPALLRYTGHDENLFFKVQRAK